jgi:6-phosphofructokinase 1
MNAAVRSFVRLGLHHRCRVLAVKNSFEGLAAGTLQEMHWSDVNNWVMQGGSILGTQRQLPTNLLEKCAAQVFACFTCLFAFKIRF